MDVHVTGHVRYLIHLLHHDDVWKAMWEGSALKVLALGDCGLSLSSPDLVIWEYCQCQQVVLVTANRNSIGPESLGQTIRTRNTPTSLPVLTLANLARVEADRSYAERTAIMLLQRLVDIEFLRGIGRL